MICLVLLILSQGISQERLRDSTQPPRYHDFDRIAIVGHVYNENKQPLSGILVEIRLAYNAQQNKPEIVGSLEFEHYIWEFLVNTLGKNVFCWAETDKNGFFRITGVPNPGAYFLLVRYAKNFLQTWVPVIIHKTGAKEFEADIYLRVRKSAIPEFSKEALEEVSLAKEAVDHNQIHNAIEHFYKAIAIEPKFAEAHYNLGILYRQTGNLREATKYFVKAIKHKDHYQLAIFALGETLRIQRKYSQSNLYLKKYLEYSKGYDEYIKKNFQAHYLIGTNCFKLKETKKAISHLSKAIELNPEIHPNTYLLLANSYMIERDGRNAIKNYRKYVNLYPDAPNIQEIMNILQKLEKMYSQKKKK